MDRGGPDGGDGGDGGSVFVQGDEGVASLIAFRDQPFRRAEDGQHGRGQRRHGRRGRDLVVRLPLGTVVRDGEGNVLAEILDTTTRVEIARGGRGGQGNARFLSNRRRAPAFAEQGEHGDDRWVNLELKLVADVALVGPPNAGKSSLVGVLTNARPKIGDYPFTTLEPTLGVVRRGPEREFVIADVPGLIEGASEGRGLGHAFLRHVERARVCAVVVDAASAAPERDAATTLHELHAYAPWLRERPTVVVLQKADLVDDRAMVAERVGDAVGLPVAGVVSAHQREGLGPLLDVFERLVAEARARAAAGPAVTVLRPRARVEAEARRVAPGVFELLGRDAIRAVRLSDLSDEGALRVVHERLGALGLLRALRRLGARDGDVVRVGDLELTYEDEA